MVPSISAGKVDMTQPVVRKGMPPRQLDRESFERRYRTAFADPIFDPLSDEIGALAAAAWDAYSKGRKAPRTRKAGSGYADPDYDIAVDTAIQEEVRNAARALAEAVQAQRAGKFVEPGKGLKEPRPK